METLSLWVWYVVVIIVVWIIFILPKVGGLPILTGLLCAALFAAILGIVLLPYYESPTNSDFDTLSLDIFIVVSTIIPVGLLLLVLLTGESKKYWKTGLRPDLGVVESVMHN